SPVAGAGARGARRDRVGRHSQGRSGRGGGVRRDGATAGGRTARRAAPEPAAGKGDGVENGYWRGEIGYLRGESGYDTGFHSPLSNIQFQISNYGMNTSIFASRRIWERMARRTSSAYRSRTCSLILAKSDGVPALRSVTLMMCRPKSVCTISLTWPGWRAK